MSFDLTEAHEITDHKTMFTRLDTMLEQHLSKEQPEPSCIDSLVRRIELSRGTVSIQTHADELYKSRRQLERIFKATVGISPKLYSQITRFRCASTLIQNSSLSLSQIANELRYTDQSHMSNEFRRFSCISPSSFSRKDVVFLQDAHD